PPITEAAADRLAAAVAARRPPREDAIGALYGNNPAKGTRAAWLQGRLIAADIRPAGFDSPCLPVADVLAEGAHDVIGDRAYGSDPQTVTSLAEAAAQGLFDGGCLPVMKHLPGHGKAKADSHFSLPDIDAPRAAIEADFAPFRALNTLPMAMTGHVRIRAIDEAPATLSKAAVTVVREEIGFAGLLMTDDISMGALGGRVEKNAVRALEAGCDSVLHCNGKMREMRAIADALPPITEAAADRLAAAVAARRPPREDDIEALRDEFDTLLGVRT
ncbi:MAG: glycoside hydrolase family 3 N-terminal domain-containing protein, partial [Pseudomonadota bacterium]